MLEIYFGEGEERINKYRAVFKLNAHIFTHSQLLNY